MIAISGGAGFIGHHLARELAGMGNQVRAVDNNLYPSWARDIVPGITEADLRDLWDTRNALKGCESAFCLAADMGGIGYITDKELFYEIAANNLQINLNTLSAAYEAGIRRLLLTSSVCVYPVHRLASPHPLLLTEKDAIPANPQDSYGFEKLMSEHLYQWFGSSFVETRIVRLENTYGPECDWHGGKEKAPAALCRKVAQAKLTGGSTLHIWGDGEQTRPFMFISDCVRGIITVMESDYKEPVNLGPDESVTIDELADLIMEAAGVDLKKVYVEGPQGVRGRNFSHERARSLGWEPKVSLQEGIKKTYDWVEKEVEEWLSSMA